MVEFRFGGSGELGSADDVAEARGKGFDPAVEIGGGVPDSGDDVVAGQLFPLVEEEAAVEETGEVYTHSHRGGGVDGVVAGGHGVQV